MMMGDKGMANSNTDSRAINVNTDAINRRNALLKSASMQNAADFKTQSDQGYQDAINFNNKQLSDLRNSISNIPSFQPIKYDNSPFKDTGTVYKAQDMSTANLPQFQAMRNRLNSQYGQQQSIAQDALDRQFAAMGGGPGSAQQNATQKLAYGIAQQKGNDMFGLDSQEAQERFNLQTEEGKKQYQSQEAANQRMLMGQNALNERNQRYDLSNQQGQQAYNNQLLTGNSDLAKLGVTVNKENQDILDSQRNYYNELYKIDDKYRYLFPPIPGQ